MKDWRDAGRQGGKTQTVYTMLERYNDLPALPEDDRYALFLAEQLWAGYRPFTRRTVEPVMDSIFRPVERGSHGFKRL